MRQYRYILFKQDLDLDKLNDVAEIFKGTHNFTNFTKRFQKTTTRTIEDIKISEGHLDDYHKKEFPDLHDTLSPIFIDIYGESFLWNMVRKMVRVFVDVAIGKLSLNQVEELLNPRENDPRANIKVLDPDYLILMDITKSLLSSYHPAAQMSIDDYTTARKSPASLGKLPALSEIPFVRPCISARRKYFLLSGRRNDRLSALIMCQLL